jgi:hypothetical protein
VALVTYGRRWLVVWLALAFLQSPMISAQISPGPLAQPHAKLEGPLKCTSCHGGRKESVSERCLACHQDVGWLVKQNRGFHAKNSATTCAKCHPDHAGRDFALIKWPGGGPEKFDHTQAGWALVGKHAKAECRDCHDASFATGPAAALSQRASPGTGWLGLEQTCTGCHEDVHRGALSKDCTSCHDLEGWKPAPKFDHAKTDYPLTGAHGKVTCAKCHLSEKLALQKDSKGQSIPLFKPVPHGECSACHSDPHHGQLGTKCAACHTTVAFATINKQTFDHSRTRYPLVGQHARVACEKCHDFSNASKKNPPFATCTACHQDVHAGTATLAGKAVDCAECHRVEGFTPATYTATQHRNARFPLEGKHQDVKCAACHLKNPPNTAQAKLGTAGTLMRPAFQECRSCHGEDHGTQLASRADHGACESCHGVAGWKPSTFTTGMHASLRVRLDGRHGEVKCSACHGPQRQGLPPLPASGNLGKAGIAISIKEVECVACHVDPHGGRFAAGGERAKTGGCLACHDTKTFHPSTIDAAAHAPFRLPLEGAHGAVPCVACHADLKGAVTLTSSLVLPKRPVPTLTFAIKETGCLACHDSPHGDQFAHRKDRGACEGCHGLDRFTPATRFDHDRDASFSLKGAHAKVACAQCHRPDPGVRVAGVPRVVYAPLSGKCESCHAGGTPVRRPS